MVTVGGDAQDVLLKRGVQLATVGLASTDVELVVEACGIGPPGVKGTKVLSGYAPPATDIGDIGDFYLDLSNSNLYGPKGTSSGGEGVRLIEDFEDGTDGAVVTADTTIFEEFDLGNAVFSSTQKHGGSLSASAVSGVSYAVMRTTIADASWGAVDFTAWARAHASLHVTSAGVLGWNMTPNPDFSGGTSVISVDWSAGNDRLELNYLNTLGGFAPTEYIPVPYDTWVRIRLSLSPVGYQFVLTVDDGGSTVYYSGTAAHMPGYLFKSLDVVTTNNAGMQTWVDDVSIGYGGDADVWGTPVSLAGVPLVFEQPDDPGAVEEGAIWIDTDSVVYPYVDESPPVDPEEPDGEGEGDGGAAAGMQSALVGMAARAKGFVVEQAKASTPLASAAEIRPDALYSPDWTGPVAGAFDLDPATLAGALPITALSPLTVTDPAGPGLDPNWRGVLSGGCTVHRAGLEVHVHKVVDAPYLQATTPVNASTGAWSVDLTALPSNRNGTWALALMDTTTGPASQVGEMWPAPSGYAGLQVEYRTITDNSYPVARTYAAATGRFSFPQGLTGRKQFRLRRKSDDAVLAEWMPSLGAVRSYLVAPGETGYGESKYTERTFAYDQAVITFAAIASGDGDWARECVRGLLELQTIGGANDGAFRFSGLQMNPSLGDAYYRTGNHAVCADALAAYLQAYPQDHSYDYAAALRRALAYLETRRSVSGTTLGLYTGGTGSYAAGGEVFDPSTVITWASSEHNFDSFHLLTRAADALADPALTVRANALGTTIEQVLWDTTNQRFFQGMQAGGGDTADPLDCHSWGAMFLAARGKHAQAASLITDEVLAPYRFTRYGGTGYAPARAGDPGYPEAAATVWAEGTFGVAMAHLAVKDVERWYRTITDIMPLQNEDGSYPYVTDEVEAYEWTSSRSVIGGAWGILAVLGHGIWGVEPVPGQLTVGSGGGGVVTVTGGDYEDVRTHGAVGDGVHDDGPAIQLAIDTAALTGRVVYLPAGVYRISQQLNLHSGTTLEGAGRSSIIRLADGYPANIDMVTTAMGDGTRDVTIRRLCVDGNKDTIGTEGTWTTETGIWTTCLHLLDVTNLVLEDLLIENSTIEGVYLGQVHYGSVTRVEASGNGFWRSDASGIHLDGSSHLVVSDCVTNSNGFHGIIFSAATDNVVTNHYSADNGFDGTRLQWSADRNRFEKFIAERNSRGIYVMHDSTLNHFTHCTLKNSLWNGFFSNNCHGNYLLFTHIENSGEYAVGSVEAGDNQYGFGNTYRNNVLGEYSLAAGSTFTAISGAGGAI